MKNLQRQPIAGKVGALLSIGGLGKPSALPPPDDPPVSALLTVDIGLIDTCDLNPRQQRNEAFFKKLKDAIRVNGLDTPIPITRRPGSERYMVAAGGNTRLQVLRELRKEEEEGGKKDGKKFLQAPCIFKPYTSDIDILAAHLRENDLRDNLVYIDHALAIVTLRRMLEEGRQAGQGSDPEKTHRLTDSEYEQILKEKMGHPISRRELGRMGYAVSVLWPVIPTALRNGAGQRLIDIIGQLQNAYLKAYTDILAELPDTESRPEFGIMFADSLSLHDEDVLDLEAVKTDLDHRISQHTGIPHHQVRLALDEQLSGRLTRPSARPEKSPRPPFAASTPPPARQEQPVAEAKAGEEADSQPEIAAPAGIGAESGAEPVQAVPPATEATAEVDVFTLGSLGDAGREPADAEPEAGMPGVQPTENANPTGQEDPPLGQPASGDSGLPVILDLPAHFQQDTADPASNSNGFPGFEPFPASPAAAFPGTDAGKYDEGPMAFQSPPTPSFWPEAKAIPEPNGFAASAFPEFQEPELTGSAHEAGFPADGAPPAEAFPAPVRLSLPATTSPSNHAGADMPGDGLDMLNPLRLQISANASLLIQAAGGVTGLRVLPDHRAAGGFTVIAQQPAASDKEGTLGWFLASLSGVTEGFAAPPGQPALIQQMFLRLDDGLPPSDTLLGHVFQLIESVVAYVRAVETLKTGKNDVTTEQRTEE